MTSASRYPVPARPHRVEDEIRRSRFITTLARAASTAEAAEFVSRISSEFADATHNCWAFVVGPPGTTDRVGMSDAGEPHGTAGRPMLNALLHGGVGDVVAVVTRYYGGTKLGTGGLVRAYAGGVQHALASLPVTEKVEFVTFEVAVAYPKVTAVQQLFPAFDAEVVSQAFDEEARFELRVPSEAADAFRAAVLEATRGQARFSR